MPTGALAQSAEDQENELLRAEELETLVAPVALYPDTLLIQVLVAATYPLEVVKADVFLDDNAEVEQEELKSLIEAEDWDESVEVLATAFPDVLEDMAAHIDWTETVGNAMLAQSDDVMEAVQVKRQAANDAGNLVSGDEQTVEVVQEGDSDTIVIQPTDPEVVYVPQYETETVYVDNSSDVGDALATGLLVFGAVAIIDEIFDDDDHWHDYWGCRNCGGWNGQPIIRNPDIDIDIDGDVNIGDRNNIGWKPDEGRQKEARDTIARKRGNDGVTTMPVTKPDRGDKMRADLAKKSGAADISQSKNPRAGVERPSSPSPAQRKAAVERTKKTQTPRTSPRPKAPQSSVVPKRQAAPINGGAMQKRAPSQRAKAGATRGRAAAGARRGR
ncbi:DUF3300 domain-containing protein [uncultured Shimia sp.]|uniref:DUF3300 domain-containing protein n=1 Tax=uncultured Shimia sp. TaxID=573152 RepID=UPI002618D1E7|nr:DUF3300 domain-containing protein [uncultured Shimia sp.]